MAKRVSKSRKQRLKAIDKQMGHFRRLIYGYNYFLAAVATVTLLMTIGSLYKLLENPSDSYLYGLAPGLIWCIIIVVYCRTRQTEVEVSTSFSSYHNLFLLLKSVGQVMTLLLFTYLETHLESNDRFWTIVICCGFYVHIVVTMMIFRTSLDCDLSASFLAATFKLMYDSTENKWEVIILVVVTGFLSSIRNFLLGKEPVPPILSSLSNNNQAPANGLIARLENTLSTFKSEFYRLENFLPLSAGGTASVSFLMIAHVTIEQKFPNIFFPALGLSYMIWVGILGWYCAVYRKVDIHEEDLQTSAFPNVRLLLKGLGQVITLLVFTSLDEVLKSAPKSKTILLCTMNFVHIVSVMVIFRITEDFDMGSEMLAVSFGLVYEITSDRCVYLVQCEKVQLVGAAIFCNCLRNILVSGKGFREQRSV